MGKVFAAVQPATGGKVALRVIPPELTRSAEVSQRFVGEVRAINRIGHRNLVDLYSVGRLHDGRLCLLMELIESEPLTALLQRATVLRLDEGVAIVLQLCEALAAAHTQGFVHGRLRPANVALGAGRTPVVKLMDFGLAALRGPASPPADAPAASVLYLAPEQCRGAAVDRRADVYALGVMLYEMFTGTTPFTGDSAADVMADHTSREPPPPSIHAHLPQPLEQLIVRTLRKKPEQRHGTVGELAKALKGLHADLPPVPPTLRLNRPG
jgi:serine/threonine-protein kinase